MSMKQPGDRTPSSEAVKRQRVEEVLTLRLNGAELHDIGDYGVEKQWNVSDRTLRRYIDEADTLLLNVLQRDREKLLGRHIAQRRSLYARAMQDGDYRAALAVLRDEAELEGLYKQRIELDAQGTFRIEAMSDEDRNAAIARILARFGIAGVCPAGPLAARNGTGDGDGSLLGGSGTGHD